jgi:hypothetical protein
VAILTNQTINDNKGVSFTKKILGKKEEQKQEQKQKQTSALAPYS